ncbi:beta-lactamase [Ostertagia ostertagi]
MNIIRIIILLIATGALISCNSNNDKPPVKEEKEAHQHEEEEGNTVSITAAQIAAIDIKLGTLEHKNLSTSIRVTGKLEVPNQNKASVTSLYSGVLRTLDIHPGSPVRKGQVLATIANTDFINIQQELISINSRLKLAALEKDRQKELVAGNAAPLKNLQRAESDFNSLKAQQQALQQHLATLGISPASVTKDNAYGMVIGVYKAGRTSIMGYGSVEKGTATLPDSNTLFELASTSKLFTTSTLQILCDKGVLNLDDKIADLLKGKVELPPIAAQTTLRHLATHTSGFPSLPESFIAKMTDENNPYAALQMQDLYDYLKTCTGKQKEGTFEYSNFGMGLLGQLIALKTNMDYEALVKTELLSPLVMNATTVTLDSASTRLLAQGYNETGAPNPVWTDHVLTGAGSFISNAADMIKFIKANLADGDTRINIVANSNNVCTGTPVTFTSTTVNSTSSATYQWQVNGVNRGGNTNTFTYIPANGDIVTCILTNPGSCSGISTAKSNSITMVTNNIQVPPVVTIANLKEGFCIDSASALRAVTTNAGTPSFQWYKNGALVGNNAVYNDPALATVNPRHHLGYRGPTLQGQHLPGHGSDRQPITSGYRLP